MTFNRSFTWNVIGSLVPISVGVLSIPFLMSKLGVELFGILTLIWALIGYFSLFDFGLGRALTQFVSKYQANKRKVELYSSVGLFLVFLLGCIGTVLIFVLIIYIPIGWLGVEGDHSSDVTNALMLAAIGIPVTTLTTGCRGVLEGFLKFKDSNLLRIYLGVGSFIFPVFAVLLPEVSLTNVVISLVLARVIVLILSISALSKIISFKIAGFSESKSVVRELTRFGSWMTVSNVASPLMVTSDRFFIAAFAGAASVAYYTVPFEIVIRALVLPAALTGAYFAHASKLINDDIEAAEKFYKEKFKLIFLMMLVISLSIALTSKAFLTLWIDVGFAEQAWELMAVLSLGVFFNGLAQLPHATIHASGETKSVAIAHLIELVIYIPVLIIFIIYYGALGAAISWALRAFIDLLIMLLLKQRLMKSSAAIK